MALVYPAFKAGKWGYKFLRMLYKGGREARKTLDLSKRGIKLQQSALGKTKTYVGRFGTKKEFATVKGGFVPKSKWYLGEGMRGVALHGKTAGKHVKKHQKLYTSGVGGAVIWDILDRDD